MDSKKIIKFINENKIDELKALAEQELAIASCKTTTDKSIQKSILKLSKVAHKDQIKYRPTIAGAYYKNNNTYITNGCWGYINNEHIDGLITAVEGDAIDLEKVFAPVTDTQKIDIDVAKIEIALANNQKYVLIKNVCFDANYVKMLYTSFEQNVNIYAIPEKNLIEFFGKNSKGLLLACRIPEEEKSQYMEVSK